MKQKRQQTNFQHYRNNFVWLLSKRNFVLSIFSVFCFSAAPLFAQTPPASQSTTAANLDAAPKSAENFDQTASLQPPKPSPPAETLIHLGDTIEVDVLGSLKYDWRGKADDEGNITSLPELNSSIATLCRTETEVAAEIAAAYAKFMRDPQIVVRVLDRSTRQPAVLFGAVRTQQRFRIQRAVRLNEIVVLSGGITDSASGAVTIMRPAYYSCAAHNQSQPRTEFMSVKLADLMAGQAAANPLIRTGDVITVEEASPVYIVGGVNAPQKVLFREGLSLTRAITSAGGLSRGGDAAKITIFRRPSNGTQSEIIEADLELIKRKKAEDLVLQPFDIVEVSQTGRERSRRPPLVNSTDLTQTALDKLPLRVIS